VAKAAGIVLAAGAASRFGAPKLALPFGGSTVIGSVVSALSEAGVAPVVVVVGEHSAEVEAALSGSDVTIAVNDDPGRGMLSSIQVGLGALPERTERFVLALGDQPRVRAADIVHLLQTQRDSGRGIVLPTYGGKRGHPVLFDARYRREILALPADRTLREVVHGHADDLLDVELTSDAVVRDIDTQEDYRDELRRAGH